MKEKLQKWGKRFFILLIWVFVFSIKINDKMIFNHLHGVFVDNAIVHTIDEQLGEMWYRVRKTAEVTFYTMSGDRRRGA